MLEDITSGDVEKQRRRVCCAPFFIPPLTGIRGLLDVVKTEDKTPGSLGCFMIPCRKIPIRMEPMAINKVYGNLLPLWGRHGMGRRWKRNLEQKRIGAKKDPDVQQAMMPDATCHADTR